MTSLSRAAAAFFTTVSPERGQKHPAGEPLETLKRFRTALDNGDVDFGQNLIARNSGVIRWEMKWKSYPRPGESLRGR